MLDKSAAENRRTYEVITGENTLFVSCFSSLWIAIGYVLLASAVHVACKDKQRKAASLARVAFDDVYATTIFLVYFAEITTVRMNKTLSYEALSIISFGNTRSLFFNYDLLGYGMMALSTFLIAFPFSEMEASTRYF